MLNQIPSEILSQIAFHLALSTPSPSSNQPSSLSTPSTSSASTSRQINLNDIPPLNLLLTCKGINEAISPTENPDLYAEIFKGMFDYKAVIRRTAGANKERELIELNKRARKNSLNSSGVVGVGRRKKGKKRKYGMEHVYAKELTMELKTRVRVLSKMLRLLQEGDLRSVEEADLWVLYFMLIENDHKNINLLLGRNPLLDLNQFVQLYVRQTMLPNCLQPGYPPGGVKEGLILWISWLISHHPSLLTTKQPSRDLAYTLRPYVFATHRFNPFFAPWTILDLPTQVPPTLNPSAPTNDLTADATARPRGIPVEYFGQTITVIPPSLSTAGILNFFDPAREDPGNQIAVNLPMAGTSTSNGTSHPPGNTSTINAVNTMNGDDSDYEDEDDEEDEGEEEGMVQDGEGGEGGEDEEGEEEEEELPVIPPIDLLKSELHDRDFERLMKCHDPIYGKGMSRKSWKNGWNGSWEGNFSFFDFDAFREMLAGHQRAIYEGPYGEQRQVWKIMETFVRIKKDRSIPPDVVGLVDDVQMVEEGVSEMGIGGNDYDGEGDKGKGERMEEDMEEEEESESEEEEELPTSKIPLKGPSTNAGFPTNAPSTTNAGLASAVAEEITMKQTVMQQVEAMVGYEIIPDEELDMMLNDPEEEKGVEILLTGSGHSAWGRFILKGRVRAWDGMASLVKEYAPDSRGKWIYRGYLIAGDTFVGRWRDTFTPENFVGYEGTFTLNRR